MAIHQRCFENVSILFIAWDFVGIAIKISLKLL